MARQGIEAAGAGVVFCACTGPLPKGKAVEARVESCIFYCTLRIAKNAFNSHIEKAPCLMLTPRRFPCSCSVLLNGAILGGGEALRAVAAEMLLLRWAGTALLLPC